MKKKSGTESELYRKRKKEEINKYIAKRSAPKIKKAATIKAMEIKKNVLRPSQVPW